MKKIFPIITIIVFALGSCEDALDLKPLDRLTYDNFYQEQEDMEAGVFAIYDALGAVQLYASSMWLVQDIASDDCDLNPELDNPNLRELDQFNIQPTNNYMEEVWQGNYTGINRANVVLVKSSEVDMDASGKNRLLAEARFLRGLFYFNLVRMFGDVPLVTEPVSSVEDFNIPRTPASVIYDTLIDDFQFAANHLPLTYTNASSKGRATRGAALGQLARVYLTLGEWDLAAERAKDVMDLGVYELHEDYADNFKVANANGKESVFEVQFTDVTSVEKSRLINTGLPSIFPFPAGVEIILPTEDLLNSFEPGDYREEVTFFDSFEYFGLYEFEPHIWKHWDREKYSPGQTTSAAANFPLMRYAEIYLIYAEALNEAHNGPTQEAYNAVNTIRERARNGVDTVLPDLSGLSQEEFRLAVLKEKRCETVNEGHRWFDLVRTGNLVEFVNRAKGDKADPQTYHYLFPIPQRERDVNSSLIQNDGY